MILWYVGATVTLQTPTDISTPEGNSGEMRTVMNLCVSLTNIMGGLDRDVVLRLTTVPLTAGNVTLCNELQSKSTDQPQLYTFTDLH